jgi:zinc protease
MPRKIQAPIVADTLDLHMPAPALRYMAQQIPIMLLPGPTQGLVKLEVLFLAGRLHEGHKLAARAASRLIREGTRQRGSAEIAEQTDFYGGTISTSDSMDHNGLVLQCLGRFFHELLPLFAEVLLDPVFPDKEVLAFLRNNQQRLTEELSKNEVIAYRELTALIFGEDHPYGYNSFPETYAALRREDVVAFWQNHYRAGNAVLVLSGEYDEAMIQAIDRVLCKNLRPGHSEASFPPPAAVMHRVFHQQKRRSHQNAIRIGRLLFDRTHPEYYPMHAVSLLLGGYFGSRLMTRIREEMGLTYNIYCHVDAMRHSGYFYISTEVSKARTKKTLDEIYKELRRLQTEPPSEVELLMMQRFAMGNLLHLLDGAFQKADTLSNLTVEGGDHEDFNHMVRAIRDIRPEEICHLAAKWLSPHDMTEVVIG